MKILFKLSFCLILFALNAHTLSAQVTEALVITPEGNVNTSGKLQENGNDLLPRGAIILWYGTEDKVAKGWGICDGSLYAIKSTETQYSKIPKQDEKQYENNPTSIRTPNLSGRFVVGAGSNGENTYSSSATGGMDRPTLTTNQMPSHTHKVVDLTTTQNGDHKHSFERDNPIGYKEEDEHKLYSGSYWGPKREGAYTDSAGAHTHSVSGETQSAGGGESFDNRPKYYALYYIMKL
jgi:microcystin-dependent protein